MRAAIHVIPAAGIRAEATLGRDGGSGIATAALRTAERVGDAADLVLVAVAPGDGALLAAYLQEGQARPLAAQLPQRGGAVELWDLAVQRTTQADPDHCARESGWCDGRICRDNGIYCSQAEPKGADG